jgi:acyl-CoA thioesterase I
VKWALLALLAIAMPMAHAEAAVFRLLVFGDSLAAGYGLAPEQSFPAQLGQRLIDAGISVQIIDDSVSGDTSADGVARLQDALARHPDAALVELGANDALRGIDPKITDDNLNRVVAGFQHAHIPVLLLGMRAPANWGRDYQRQFDAIYPRLAAAEHVLLYPFVLDGVALDPKLNQADLLHPNAAGAAAIAQRLVPDVLRLMSEADKLR